LVFLPVRFAVFLGASGVFVAASPTGAAGSEAAVSGLVVSEAAFASTGFAG